MNKAAKKFHLYAMVSLFLLLSALLAVINGINFTMAANDADRVTGMLANEQGRFRSGVPAETPADGSAPAGSEPQGEGPAGDAPPSGDPFTLGRMGPMGPDSPELRSSVRYFTFRFDRNGNAETVAMQISAFTEEEALALAKKLSAETVGWTKFTYRYRVYEIGNDTYVTVIDQGRELLASYRILLISAVGEVAVLIISFFFLRAVGKRLFQPLEEADRKQKRFLAEAESELKIPLTVMSADAEWIEREYGPSDAAASLRRQVGKTAALVKKLGSLAIFEDETAQNLSCNLSDILSSAVDQAEPAFAARSVSVRCEADEGVLVKGDPDLLSRAVGELTENARKFALTRASFSLKRDGDRVRLTVANDADLNEVGNLEQVFDRFTTLGNAAGKDGSGLGLSFVRDVVRSMGGRVQASAEGGMFLLRIVL